MPLPDGLELKPLQPLKKPGTFPKGYQGPGRARGIPNKCTRELRAAIIDAAIQHGADGEGRDGLIGYLTLLAARHPRAFSALLGRLLPLQLDASVSSSIVAAVNVLAVPADRFVTREALAVMLEPMTLESEAIDDPTEPEQLDDAGDLEPAEPEPIEPASGAEYGMRVRSRAVIAPVG